MAESIQVCVTLPAKMKKQIDEYNKENPYDKISISRVAQAALNKKLIELAGKADCC